MNLKDKLKAFTPSRRALWSNRYGFLTVAVCTLLWVVWASPWPFWLMFVITVFGLYADSLRRDITAEQHDLINEAMAGWEDAAMQLEVVTRENMKLRAYLSTSNLIHSQDNPHEA